MPSGPSVTARRAAGSATIVMSASARRAASAGLPADAAPSSTSSAAFSGVRFHTITSCPAARNRRANREPIAPSPITATVLMRTIMAADVTRDTSGAVPKVTARSCPRAQPEIPHPRTVTPVTDEGGGR